MSTKYDLRSDPGVEKNYGKLLLEMVSVVPDGVVCFFVSYSYMDGIVNSWHETGILKVNIHKINSVIGKNSTVCFQALPMRSAFRLHVVGDNAA